MTRLLRIAGETALPFHDDASYLEEEMRWLRVRVSRVLAERQLSEALEDEANGDPAHVQRPGRIGSREMRCRVVEYREKEKRLRDEIDVRLALNRSSRGSHTLGRDVVCSEASLNTEERVVLLITLPYCLSQSLAESTLKDLAHHWGAISVGDAISVLAPDTVGDWLRLRRLFRASAPLVSQGLVKVGKASGDCSASSLLSATIELTLEAFGRIVGDSEAAEEGD